MRKTSYRALGLATASSVVLATAVCAAGPTASAQPPTAPAAVNRTVVLRPDGTVAALQAFGAGTAAAALADTTVRPAAPATDSGVRPGVDDASTTIALAAPDLGGRAPGHTKLWFYGSTGSSTTLEVEVLARGAVVAHETVAPDHDPAWRSVGFDPGASDLGHLQVRLSSRGGTAAQVLELYASVTVGTTTLTVRPVADLPALAVLPQGSAQDALDDDVTAPDSPDANDYLRSTGGDHTTSVSLATTDVSTGSSGGKVWFYAKTKKNVALRVELVGAGAVLDSIVLRNKHGWGWRSVKVPAGDQSLVDGLEVRFSTSGAGTAQVRAAYAALAVADGSAAVDAYLSGLTPVRAGADVAVHQVGDPQSSTSDPLPTLDQKTTPSVAKFACTSKPVSSTQSPSQIVIQNPDGNKLWLGGLLQGQGYQGGLGSLVGLDTDKRAPLTIYTSLMDQGTTRTVTDPNPASVHQAVADLVLQAQQHGVAIPANIAFKQESETSSDEGLVQVGFSAKYLGASVTGNLKSSRSAQRSEVRVDFVQRMFDVYVVRPSSPSGWFSSGFGQADLDSLHARGQIAPDNPPVVISRISYGRLLHYSVTSTESQEDLEGAIEAAYKAGDSGASGSVSDRQQQVLNNAEFNVLAIGGPVSNVESLIKTHNVQDYFAAPATLDTAVPISYQMDNMDGTAATFGETTDYTLRTCEAIANHSVLSGAVVSITPPKFYLDAKRDHADLHGEIAFQNQDFWNRERDSYQTIQNHLLTTPTQFGSHGGGNPLHGPDDKIWTQTVSYDTSAGPNPRIGITGSANCILWFPEFGEGSNQYSWSFDVRNGTYGPQEVDGGSKTCDTKLRFDVQKVQDVLTWEP